MEFKRLAEVDVVEVANDTDKVLIEQNGEIKRVPKTEVGGSGSGNVLIITATEIPEERSIVYSANMTLDKVRAALYDGPVLMGAYVFFYGAGYFDNNVLYVEDVTESYGTTVLRMGMISSDLPLYWTVDGISENEPMGPQ